MDPLTVALISAAFGAIAGVVGSELVRRIRKKRSEASERNSLRLSVWVGDGDPLATDGPTRLLFGHAFNEGKRDFIVNRLYLTYQGQEIEITHSGAVSFGTGRGSGYRLGKPIPPYNWIIFSVDLGVLSRQIGSISSAGTSRILMRQEVEKGDIKKQSTGGRFPTKFISNTTNSTSSP
jgi:hypothetical protein